MKAFFDKILKTIARSPFCMNIFEQTVLPACRRLQMYKYQQESERDNEQVRNNVLTLRERLFEDSIVQAGLFKGMKWMMPDTFWGFPKLLGIYEREIHAQMITLLSRKYHQILNVGSADGYYVNGLARLFPGATRIYAYDLNDRLHEITRQVAKLNGVLERIHFDSHCDRLSLKSFDFSNPALIMSDCEGFERELFDQNCLKNLTLCDIVIEVHDGVFPGVTEYLENLFRNTHEHDFIPVLSDFQRQRLFQDPRVADCDYATRCRIVNENRSTCTGWLILKAIRNDNERNAEGRV